LIRGKLATRYQFGHADHKAFRAPTESTVTPPAMAASWLAIVNSLERN
jgi:hypothetical protein